MSTSAAVAEPAPVAAHDVADAYLERVRSYYQALGYGAPYVWAHHIDVPFHRLARPLVALSRRDRHDGSAVPARQGRPGPGRAVQRRRQVLQRLFGRHARTTTTCASRTSRSIASTRPPRTPGRWFPLPALRRAAAAGRIGMVAARFHGAPTNRSQRTTLEVDAAEIVARCRADGVDAAILVANCPVCHQTSSLVARRLEASGHRHGGARLRQGHRRARRRAALRLLRLSARQRRRAPARPRLAGRDAGARARRCSRRRRRRGRPCSRRCAGARAPTGSSTTATSSA